MGKLASRFQHELAPADAHLCKNRCMPGAALHFRTNIVRAVVLALLVGFVWAQRRFVSSGAHGDLIIAIGFLLLSGTLGGSLFGWVGLPQLTGFLLVGVLVGPHVIGLIGKETAADLSFINTLALALIALAGGAELQLEHLRKSLRSLAWATVFQSALGLVVSAGAFIALSRFIPFARGMGSAGLCGLGLLWGAFAISRSPSATLAVLSQTRADGPVTRFSLAFIMSSDIVVVVLLTSVMMIAQPLLDPSIELSLASLGNLGHEVVSSISLGTTLGLALALYLRFVGRQLLLVLVAIGFALTEGLRYLRFDPLLTFVIAGFIVRNASREGPKLLEAIEQTGTLVYVVFFATAGVALDVPLLKQLWPIALVLCGVRALISWLAHNISARVAQDEDPVRRYGWMSLFSQAGLTLGLAGLVENAFPQLGGGFRSLVIATVAINQIFGPVLFKLALDRAGETGAGAPEPAHNGA